MKILDPQNLKLRLYQTLPHACSYLVDKEATTVFLDPDLPLTHDIYSQLALKGFRRSGKHIYRPQCASCNSCQSARIKALEFTPSNQQKRVVKRNKDLTAKVVDAKFHEEHYQLYANYLNVRHCDGDMYPANKEQYESFLLNELNWSRLVEFRNAEQELLAVAAVDELADGFSAIYTFFNPSQAEAKRSLGVYAVLWLVAQAQQLGLPYVYLGYFINESPKMNYKKNYQPLEVFNSYEWQDFCPKP